MPAPIQAGPSDLQWYQIAQQTKLNALSEIRGSAEKWGGTIGALTGVFSIVALIKGREDITALTTAGQAIVGILLLLALLLAFLATLFAAFAAQGIPITTLAANNPRAFQRQYENQARMAGQWLHWSRLLVAPATLCLALAIGFTWFGPTKAAVPGHTVVIATEKSGAVLCGDVLSKKNGDVYITTGAGGERRRLH